MLRHKSINLIDSLLSLSRIKEGSESPQIKTFTGCLYQVGAQTEISGFYGIYRI